MSDITDYWKPRVEQLEKALMGKEMINMDLLMKPGETIQIITKDVKYPQKLKVTIQEDGAIFYSGEPEEM